MEVHLLVYDLSQGMARQMSMGILGFQLDAIYHTSIELDGLEYVYDGNVVAIAPGSSHLGRPLQRLSLGKSQLPKDVINQYLQSLRDIYTVQAYNLWRHNCNNFSNDFATFLVGSGIPDHILHMPDAVLQSPLGAMLMPALNQQVEAGRLNRERAGIWGIQGSGQQVNGHAVASTSKVRQATNVQELDSLLASAQESCAVVFFTSPNCGPCKVLYPIYDELAAELRDKCLLVKVDIARAFDVGSRYSIRATPTFITFLRGKEESRWSGADSIGLRGNVQLLVQSAHPTHPHASLRLPVFHNPAQTPCSFTKTPPIPKLLAKMGPSSDHGAVKSLSHFIHVRNKEGPAEATLPDMHVLTTFISDCIRDLPPDLMFTIVDLLRCALVDPRVSGFFAEEKDQSTIMSLLTHVNGLSTACPYALRLVSLQMACNLFSTPLYPDRIMTNEGLRIALTTFVSSSFLDSSHSQVRVAAASLLFNIALFNNERRRANQTDSLPEADQIELAAALLEAVSQENESAEALRGMLLALGYLAYLAPLDGELVDLLRTMEASETVMGKKQLFKDLPLVDEVGGVLLGKGLSRP